MLALLLALASPELDVRGISVSYGNTVVENAFRNAVAILRRAGKRATLAVGARRPLKRPLAVARDTHGESGLGYAELPPAGVILDFVNDVLPIAALLKPAALGVEEQRLVVDLEEGAHRGHTRIDPHGARVNVATRVDVAAVRPLLSERVFRWAVHQTATPIVSQEAAV